MHCVIATLVGMAMIIGGGVWMDKCPELLIAYLVFFAGIWLVAGFNGFCAHWLLGLWLTFIYLGVFCTLSVQGVIPVHEWFILVARVLQWGMWLCAGGTTAGGIIIIII